MSVRLLLVLFSLSVAPGQFALASEGPSFDCAKASSDVERLICGSQDYLAPLDRQLAHSYRQALDAAGGGRDRIVNKQRAWLRQRSVDCRVVLTDAKAREAADACLTRMYVRRIAALDRLRYERQNTARGQEKLPAPLAQPTLLKDVQVGDTVLSRDATIDDIRSFNVMNRTLEKYWEYQDFKDQPVPKRMTCDEWSALNFREIDTISISHKAALDSICKSLSLILSARPAQHNHLPANPIADIRLLSTALLASPMTDDWTQAQVRRTAPHATFGDMEKDGNVAVFYGSVFDTDRLDEDVIYVDGEGSYVFDNCFHWLTPMARGDFNNDGYEDILVTFSYKAVGGTWGFTETVLLTRLTEGGSIQRGAISAGSPDLSRREPDLEKHMPSLSLYRDDIDDE